MVKRKITTPYEGVVPCSNQGKNANYLADLAHLVERLFCTQEVVGSSPAIGTKGKQYQASQFDAQRLSVTMGDIGTVPVCNLTCVWALVH